MNGLHRLLFCRRPNERQPGCLVQQSVQSGPSPELAPGPGRLKQLLLHFIELRRGDTTVEPAIDDRITPIAARIGLSSCGLEWRL
jgi:hypothetical protein